MKSTNEISCLGNLTCLLAEDKRSLVTEMMSSPRNVLLPGEGGGGKKRTGVLSCPNAMTAPIMTLHGRCLQDRCDHANSEERSHGALLGRFLLNSYATLQIPRVFVRTKREDARQGGNCPPFPMAECKRCVSIIILIHTTRIPPSSYPNPPWHDSLPPPSYFFPLHSKTNQSRTQ